MIRIIDKQEIEKVERELVFYAGALWVETSKKKPDSKSMLEIARLYEEARARIPDEVHAFGERRRIFPTELPLEDPIQLKYIILEY